MSAADLRFGTEGPAIVACLSGEIDMSNASELAASIAGSATNDLLAVVLDVSEVEYLDSAGIQMVFSLRESLRVRGQQLLLVVPDGSPVNDALRLAGVVGLIEASPDVAGALSGLGANGGSPG